MAENFLTTRTETTDRPSGPAYRDELASARAQITNLERKNRELLEVLHQRHPNAMLDQVRDLDLSLRRWDRIRASLSIVLGFTGLIALQIAERWSDRAALLATTIAMVGVGITLAWPTMVRAKVDPSPYALDVSFPWRKRKPRPTTNTLDHGVRVDVSDRHICPTNEPSIHSTSQSVMAIERTNEKG